MREYVDGVGANFGRVRIIKLEPQDRDAAIRSLHRDDNNRFNPDDEGWVVRSWLELTDNPDSYMLLMDSGPDGLPDPSTEMRLPLHRGARFVVDTQRLWHVVVHNGDAPRFALITSFESGPALERWIESQRHRRRLSAGAPDRRSLGGPAALFGEAVCRGPGSAGITIVDSMTVAVVVLAILARRGRRAGRRADPAARRRASHRRRRDATLRRGECRADERRPRRSTSEARRASGCRGTTR